MSESEEARAFDATVRAEEAGQPGVIAENPAERMAEIQAALDAAQATTPDPPSTE